MTNEELDARMEVLKAEIAEIRRVKRNNYLRVRIAEKRAQMPKKEKPAKPQVDPAVIVQRYKENSKKYYETHREEILAKSKARRDQQKTPTTGMESVPGVICSDTDA